MNTKKLSQLRAAAARGDEEAIAKLFEVAKSPEGLNQLHAIAQECEERWAKKKRAELKQTPPRELGHWETLQKHRNAGYVPIVLGGAPGLGKKK